MKTIEARISELEDHLAYLWELLAEGGSEDHDHFNWQMTRDEAREVSAELADLEHELAEQDKVLCPLDFVSED